MKAVVIATTGDPQVLQVQEVENPEIGDDKVLIRVDAAAINRADTLQRKGLHPPSKAAVPTPVSNVLESSKLLERSSFDGRLAIRCVLFFLVEGMLKKWLFQLGKFFLPHWCFSEGCCWYS